MRTRTIVPTAAIAIVGALGATGASAAGLTPSEVTLKGTNGDYHGEVKSSKRSCERNRTVVLYKMVGSKPTPSQDQRIGSDTTDGGSEWSAGNTGYKHGKFYARVTKRLAARGGAQRVSTDCAAATSEVLKR